MTHDVTVERDELRRWTILREGGRDLVFTDELAHRMPDPESFTRFIVEAAETGGIDHAGLMVTLAERALEEVTDEATAIADKAAWAVTIEVRNAYITPERTMARYLEVIDLAAKESSG